MSGRHSEVRRKGKVERDRRKKIADAASINCLEADNPPTESNAGPQEAVNIGMQKHRKIGTARNRQICSLLHLKPSIGLSNMGMTMPEKGRN